MFFGDLFNKSGKGSENKGKKQKSLRLRSLRIETLENRELLSVNPLLPLDTPPEAVAVIAAEQIIDQENAEIPSIQAAASVGYDAYEWNLVERLGLTHHEISEENWADRDVMIFPLNGAYWTQINGVCRLVMLNMSSEKLNGSLDLSDCTELVSVYCPYNQLTSLNLFGCTALEELRCYSNQLTSLNVTGCTALELLFCDGNQLKLSTIKFPEHISLNFSGSDQKIIPETLPSNAVLDLSSEYMGGNTTYTWHYNGLPLSKPFYTNDGGKFTFDYIPSNVFWCEMTNPNYPGITITTTRMTITEAASQNYAVLYAGGIIPEKNPIKYYAAIKDLYTVLTDSYGLPKENIYVIYADGTDPGRDQYGLLFNRNSDMSFALGSEIYSANLANLNTVFTILGNKMTSADDHLLFFTSDHGGGDLNNPGNTTEETLSGWKGKETLTSREDEKSNITAAEVAAAVEKIKQGYVTLVFSQCLSGGILDNIIDPITGQKKISTDAQIYGMAAANHYEVSRSGRKIGFENGFINALKNNITLTSEAFDFAMTNFGIGDPKKVAEYVAQYDYPNNGGTYVSNSAGRNTHQHPWEIGELDENGKIKTFSIFATNSSGSSGSFGKIFPVTKDRFNDSTIVSSNADSVKDAMELLGGKSVYVNFGYGNPSGATVSAKVTVTGGTLTQPRTFSLSQSAMTENDWKQGQLTTNLDIGTYGVGTYTVRIELTAEGETVSWDKTFEVIGVSQDVSDTLTGAKAITLGAAVFDLTDKIGDGQYAGKDVDVYRFDVSAADIGKTVTFGSMGAEDSILPVDTSLRLFSATGTELAISDFSRFVGDSLLYYTMATAGTYYLAVSALDNTTYDPNTANSGNAGDTGEYQLFGMISETKADLSMNYDYSWIDNIVVSNKATGTITDYDLTADDTIYVNYKFTNSGYISASAVTNRITITGPDGYSKSQNFTSSTMAPGEFQTLPTNFNWGKLAAGAYTITVTLDVNGVLSELHEDNNTASWQFDVTASLSLSAPTNFTAVYEASTGVTLKWNAVSGAETYKVYRLDGDQWVTVSPKNFTGTTFIDETARGETGTYGVRAYNDVGYSDMATVTIKSSVKPAAPTVTATYSAGTGVTLKWNAVSGAETYKVYRLDDGQWVTISEKNFTGTTFIDSGVPASGTYGVRAYNDVGYSDMAIVSAASKPTMPTNFRSTGRTSNSVTLAWDAQAGLTGYRLEYAEFPEGVSFSYEPEWLEWTPAPAAGATSATVSNLKPDMQYAFRLTAIGATETAASDNILVKTTATKPDDRHNEHDWQKVTSQGLEDYATWTEINGEYRLTEINANNAGLKGSLNLSGCTALETLWCYDNQLTELNVTACTALQTLVCSYNQLTMLNVSTCTALTELYCADNQLIELNVFGCIKLVSVSCFDNQLTELNLSTNTALKELWCLDNQLTELDVSNNTALNLLNLGSNRLTELNVSDCTALTFLACDDNRLTELDVSNNTALETLYCYDNQLTELDVSKNTALKLLSCFSLQLTKLDVSKNTALEKLYCYGNQLIELNISNNTSLEELYCDNNRLTFSALPIVTDMWIYSYGNQQPMAIKYVNGKVDLSSEYSIGGVMTNYIWHYENGTVVDSSLVTSGSGVFTFAPVLTGKTVYCKMTNATFPDLTLETTKVTIGVDAKPGVPTNFVATVVGDKVNLSWNAVSTADTYQVWRWSGADWVTVAKNISGTSCVDMEPELGSGTYIVKARNAVGNSDQATTSTSTEKPKIPKSFTATEAGTVVNLSWSPAAGADSYQVWRWDITKNNWITVARNVTGTSCVDKSPELGSGVYIMKALNGNGYGDLTTATTFGKPAAPIVTANYVAGTGVELTWGTVPEATGYRVWRRLDGQSWAEVPSISRGNITATSFTDTGAPMGTKVYYAVRAYVQSLFGEFEEVSVVTSNL